MATVNIPLSQFSDLCRLCGSKTTVLMGLHIFEREGDLRQISKKIKACLPVQVSSTDKLPKMICEECVFKLDEMFEFRERSMKTEYELNNILKNVFSPVCTESIGIAIDTFCSAATTEHGENLHVQSTEVGISLENNSEQLDAIMNIPLNHHPNMIKCEPEIIIKHDSIQCANSNLQHTAEPDSEGESIGAEAEPNGSCNMTEGMNNNLQMQEIRTLQNITENPMKVGEVQNTRTTYIVPNPAEPVHQPQHPPQWYFCNICGKAFDSSDTFQAHCEVHWKKCAECGISVANDEVLFVHMRDVHPYIDREQLNIDSSLKKKSEGKKDSKVDMKACTECGKEYKTNYKLAEHMRKHTGEKPYKCSMCDKAFRSKIGLAQHEAKHTGHFDYNCGTCGKGFQCKSYLIVHQRVHSDLKPYPCETCGRNFKTKQSLLDHQNRHLGLKPYICETCGRGFITKGLCKSHQKVHSGLDNRQYPCTVCNKLFVSKSYLNTHLRIHTGEKPFICEVCGKGFLTRVDLRIHSTMHTGEKSFVCEMCGKAFARRDALRCHKRSHTGERPYKCDICGQGFTQFSPMAIHKRLHTGERPYQCDICLKAFVSRSTMMAHRKKHTT